MPSQLIHLQICADALEALEGRHGGHPPAHGLSASCDLTAFTGHFLLGAIAPDAWAVSGSTRQATHFWDPLEDASSTARLRAAHPELGDPDALDPAARAYLAGYCCHLVTDEQWTFTIYRAYFGRHSAFKASPEGAMTQLALQALLEQRLRERRPADVQRWLHALADTPAVSLPFLTAEAVARWRDVLLEACARPSMAEAFRYFLSRTRGPDAGALDWPVLMHRAAAHVPPEAVQTFQTRAARACLAELERPRTIIGR
ncbi:MAG TPA: hypothetical protein VHS99_15505 [Chloroflexota bacterium]|nr:hypothetical protein [Chloroflexota bacterium]